MLCLSQAQAAQALSARKVFAFLQELASTRDEIAELAEENEDWREEAEALNEELDFLHASWDKAMRVNQELSTRLQALLELGE